MAMALKLAEYNVLQRPLVTHSHSAAPSPPLTAASEEGRLQSGRKESANHNDTVARRTKSRRLSRRERAEGEIITSSINTIVSSSSGGCLPSRPLRPASRVAAVNTTKLLHEPGFLKNTKIEIDMAALTGYNSCLAALL
ncbi:hypothetical protein Zmor_012039 [Zophobas morio]|jgi:hypothetical protein|uniref:Uncharacterized protein n=1 Tax=Zophobas morio TaxID=2755281 RepID=A0AA38HHM9_9CUCU|nr:hypothetical protein Zmor_012039 [Zophobas morio]